MKNFHYYGTSEFGALVLEGLFKAGLAPSLVVSTAPKPAGRKQELILTPVSVFAKSKGLEVLEVSTLKSAEIQNLLASNHTSVAILASFGKIIPQVILDMYPKGIVNVHPSLLPQYRGPAPIQSAIRDGLTETAVSIMLLDAEVDHGPLLAQERCVIVDDDTTPTLSKKLADMAVKLLLITFESYLNNKLSPVPQNHALATFTKMITRDDGATDFSKPAQELYNQWRAFTPWPGLWTRWKGQRLKLSKVSAGDQKLSIGLVTNESDVVMIGCGRGSLVVHSLQLEGGKELLAADFCRGHKNFVGSTLPS